MRDHRDNPYPVCAAVHMESGHRYCTYYPVRVTYRKLYQRPSRIQGTITRRQLES